MQTQRKPEGRLSFTQELNEDRVNWYGRVRAGGEGTDFSNSAAGFEVSFRGSVLYADIRSASSAAPDEAAGSAYAYVFTDGERDFHLARKIKFSPSEHALRYCLAELPQGGHTVRLLKCTEPKFGTAALVGLETDGEFLPPPEKPSLKVEILGDSILSGSECMRMTEADSVRTQSENSLASYGFVAAELLGAQVSAVTRSGALVSGYRDLASIPQYYGVYGQFDPTPWDFGRFRPDIVIVDLGSNDRFAAAPDGFVSERYLGFLRLIRARNPSSLIVVCEGAILLLPELAEGVVRDFTEAEDGNIRCFHLPCRHVTAGHPTEAEHRANGEALAEFLRAELPHLKINRKNGSHD